MVLIGTHCFRGSRRSSVKATLTDMAQRNLESAAKAGRLGGWD